MWKNLGDNPAHGTAPGPGPGPGLVAPVALVNDCGREVGEPWLPNGQLLEWQRRVAREHEEVRNRLPQLLEIT